MQLAALFGVVCQLLFSVFGEVASPTPSADQKREGEQLFVKSFAPSPQRRDGGDGLGPLFNHVSCTACHRQGAIGGGGDIEFNVALITAQVAPGKQTPERKLLLRSLRSLHPSFVAGEDTIVATLILHRFGPDERYFERKIALGGLHIPTDPSKAERVALQEQLTREPLRSVHKMNHLQLIRSQRNTTALFGAGLIDAIPDEVLHDLARQQTLEGKVSGRVPPIGPNRVGRFGWRGQKEHLHDFVLAACANELGLEVPDNPQPINPIKPKYRPAGLDLTAQQCQLLTAYVASLPPPKRVRPAAPDRLTDCERGRELFASTGCALCHVERVGSVTGIYSDLLLHDMGPGLADPAPAEPALSFVKSIPREDLANRPSPPQFMPPRGYFGSQFSTLQNSPKFIVLKDEQTGGVKVFRAESSNLTAEWRTPPLWGVADSAPYLHDGRAESLVDAINLHDGEAAFSAKAFRGLDLADRVCLIKFLRSLRAP